MEKDNLNSICVFCGSREGKQEIFKKTAIKLGEILSAKGITLIYGGSTRGLMGHISKTVMKKGGKAIGIIPSKIYDNVEHEQLSETHVVDTMHERKAMMYEKSDGFIIFPGGIGTLDEFAEIFTWLYLEYHGKPIGILNINGYYDKLLEFFDNMIKEGFLNQGVFDLLIIENNIETLLEKINEFDITTKDKDRKKL